MLDNILFRWNFLDTLLYKFDEAIAEGKEFFSSNEPDVESMIEVETSYLKKENEQLKELHYPKGITVQDRGYYCPNKKCKTRIEDTLVEQYRIKHCPECGQRIFLNKCYKATDSNI